MDIYDIFNEEFVKPFGANMGDDDFTRDMRGEFDGLNIQRVLASNELKELVGDQISFVYPYGIDFKSLFSYLYDQPASKWYTAEDIYDMEEFVNDNSDFLLKEWGAIARQVNQNLKFHNLSIEVFTKGTAESVFFNIRGTMVLLD